MKKKHRKKTKRKHNYTTSVTENKNGDHKMARNLKLHPGTLLKEDILEFNNLSVTQAAKLLGITRINLSNILNEKTSISPNMAIRISKVFGGSPDPWLKLQLRYDLINAQEIFDEQHNHLEKFKYA